MTTYGTVFNETIRKLEREVHAAREAADSGDLWQSMAYLNAAHIKVEEARQLLLDVSRTAFERVFQERAS